MAEAIENITRIMKGTNVAELTTYTRKITVYDDYVEFVTKDGALLKMTKGEVPEGNFSKLDALIDQVEEIDDIAQAAYNSIRSRGLDINAIRTISTNTGLSETEVTKLIEHVFVNKHLIPQSGGKLIKNVYFTPDPEIAYAFKRAEQGPLTQQGKDWFRQYANHELEEKAFELQGYPYRNIESWDPTLGYTGNPPGAHDLAVPFKPTDFFPGYNPY